MDPLRRESRAAGVVVEIAGEEHGLVGIVSQCKYSRRETKVVAAHPADQGCGRVRDVAERR